MNETTVIVPLAHSPVVHTAGVSAPKLGAPDNSLSLLKDGYCFISKRARFFHSDAFTTRLLGEPVVCLSSREAADLSFAERPAEESFVAQVDVAWPGLNAQLAGIELLNVIRPICAIATYISFILLALHDHPRWRELLNGELEPEHFVQEVRRYYPFTPFVGARARETFSWRGVTFARGQLALLDIYGLNHDPRYWEQPDSFDPHRFALPVDALRVFIPQGGGSAHEGHRCAGEDVTVALMRQALSHLLALNYEVPAQDLRYSLSRIPARLASGFVISQVKAWA